MFDQTALYDRNIRFENNTIHTFDNRIVRADRVDGLVVKGNTIIKTNMAKQLYPNAPLFELINCRNILIEGNTYQGEYKTAIKADVKSRNTLSVSQNKGF